MPIYQYQHEETKEIIEEVMPMNIDHPEQIERNGKIFKRVWGGFRAQDKANACNEYPYVSLRHSHVFKEGDAPRADATVAGIHHKNVPIVTSKKHERELMSKYGLTRE